MSDRDKTKSELIAELEVLRAEVDSLRGSRALFPNSLPQNDRELTRAILEGIPDIINLVDADGIYLGSLRTNIAKDLIPKDINPIGKNITELLPLDIALAQLQAIQRAVTTQQVQMIEQRAILDDRLQYEEVRIVPIRANAVLMIIRDMSEQQSAQNECKLAENALRESENRFRQIVQTQTDFLLQSRSDTTITFANESLCRALGVSLTQIVGQKWIDFANPDDIQGILENIAALTPENPSFYAENRDRRADGQLGWTQWLNQGIFNQQGQLIEIQSVGRDITVRKQAEDALRESQYLIEKIATTTPNLLYIYDHLEQRNVYMNRSVAEMLGYSAEDVQQMGASLFPTICHPEDLMRVYEAIERCASLQDGELIEIEYRVRNARGAWRWLHSRDTVFSRSSDGRVKQTLGTSEDITDRKLREEILENISLGFSAQTGDAFFRSLVQYLTKALKVEIAFVCEILEGQVKIVVAYADGKTLEGFAYDLHNTPCEIALKGQICFYPANVQQLFPKDGMLAEMEIESYGGVLLASSTGEVLGLISVMSRSPIVDAQFTQEVLTIFAARASSELERQQAEEKLQLQYQRAQLFAEVTLKIRQSLRLEEILQIAVSEIRRILGASRAIVFQIQSDGSGKVTEESVDVRFKAIIGQNIIDHCFHEVFIEQYRKGRVGVIDDVETDLIQPCHAKFLRQFDVRANLVVPILQSDYLWGLLIVHQCDRPRQWTSFETELLGQLASQLGIAIAQSQLIENLQQSEEKLRLAIDLNHIGSFDWNLATGEGLWNDNLFRLMGYEPYQVKACYETWRDRVYHEDLADAEQAVAESLKEHTDLKHEYRVIHPDGSLHWMLCRGRGIYNELGQAERIVGVILDISDRKQAEAEMLQRTERDRLVGTLTQSIRKSLDLQEMLNTTVKEVRNFLQTDRTMILRFTPVWCEVIAESVAESWQSVLGAKVTDIWFQNIQDRARQVESGRINPDIYGAVNDIYATGYDTDHIDFLTQLQVKSKLVVPIFQGGDLWGLLIAHHCQNTRFWQPQEIELLQKLAEQIEIAIHQANLYQQAQLEIAERKLAENALQQLNQELERRVEDRTEQLRQSEDRFRGFFSHAPIGIAVAHIETLKFAAINHAFCNLLGYSGAEMLALSCPSISHPDDLELEHPLSLSLIKGEIASYQLEKRFLHKNGEVIFGLLTATALKDSAGKITHIMGMVQDIGARKSAELQLRASLKEKEVMLKEIHHRVKNNLQMVSSLLSLQASYIDDRQTLALFAESQNRIKVMALIHEKLYRSDNLAKINLCEYLTELVSDVMQSYRAPSGTEIDYKVEVEAVDLGIELAIPCGLIVNELVSNAIEHAFPSQSTGEIWIQFSKSDRIQETDYYLLSVGNNGVNFPQEIDFRNTESLGLQLVCGLTQQLRGKIELKNGEGCRFEILFPHST